jgi:hypothetical protein
MYTMLSIHWSKRAFETDHGNLCINASESIYISCFHCVREFFSGVREMSGNCQGILIFHFAGHPDQVSNSVSNSVEFCRHK